MSNFGKIEKLVLKGNCKWAKVTKPGTNFDGKPEYSIDIEVSDATVKTLYDKGMSNRKKVKEVDGIKYLSFSREVFSKAGKEIPKLRVVDCQKKDFDGIIGNGSVVKLVLELLPYENKFGKGIRPRLGAVQVLELKVFEPRDSLLDEFDVEGEVEVESSSKDELDDFDSDVLS